MTICNVRACAHMHVCIGIAHAWFFNQPWFCSRSSIAWPVAAADLQGLLMFASPKELAEFAESRGWSIDGSTVTFSKMEDETPAQKLPSTQLIQETLAYAKELERIV